jgi:hypothetical protein
MNGEGGAQATPVVEWREIPLNAGGVTQPRQLNHEGFMVRPTMVNAVRRLMETRR